MPDRETSESEAQATATLSREMMERPTVVPAENLKSGHTETAHTQYRVVQQLMYDIVAGAEWRSTEYRGGRLAACDQFTRCMQMDMVDDTRQLHFHRLW